MGQPITMEALSTTADVDALVTGKGTYYGCSVFAGTAVVKDSLVSSAGTIIHNVALPGQMLGGHGVRFQNGISIDLTTGPVTVYFTRGA
jgi:hypothetical protein